MCFDARAVNAQVLVVCIRIQFLKNVQNGSVVTPLAESAVNGLMWPKPRRDIRLGCTASGQPKHSIEHHPIILWWPAGLSSWNQIFDPVPLGIGQLVSPCCHKITPMLFLLFYCSFGFCAIYMWDLSFQIHPRSASMVASVDAPSGMGKEKRGSERSAQRCITGDQPNPVFCILHN